MHLENKLQSVVGVVLAVVCLAQRAARRPIRLSIRARNAVTIRAAK